MAPPYVAAAVAAALLGVGDSCGMVTHQLISQRATQQYLAPRYAGYAELLQRNPQSWQPGATFPDWLYTCGQFHDNGEWFHWSPAQAKAVEYIRALPKPWSSDTEALVAFWYGIQSHFIADINWHGLAESPHGYGFIETVGISDFGCTGDLCNTAHSASDTGGEFVAAWGDDLSFLAPLQWSIPIDALVDIMAAGGLNTTGAANAMRECHAVFSAGTVAVSSVSPVLFSQQTGNAPQMVEGYTSLPFGGIDDMAVWTGRMANRLFQWLEEGVPDPVPPPVVDRLGSRAQRRLMSRANEQGSELRKLADLVRATPEFAAWEGRRDRSAGLSDEALASIRRQVLEAIRRPDTPATEKAPEELQASPSETASFEGAQPFDYVGAAMAVGDFNGDGIQDVAFGAPGHTPGATLPLQGAVYVQYGMAGQKMQLSAPVLLSFPDEANARFGWSLVACDLNADGVQDLAVGAPSAGWDDWQGPIPESPAYNYYGQVLVFFGAKDRGLATMPDVRLVSSTQMESFGLVLAATPAGSLLVGAPMSRGGAGDTGIQAGRVRIFRAGPQWASGTNVADTAADQTIEGPDGDFAWFGASLLVATGSDGQPLLVVGAPLYRSPTAGAVGRVYGFQLGAGDEVSTDRAFSITGTVSKGKFGFSLAAGHPLGTGSPPHLAIGAPAASTKGTGFFQGDDLAGSVEVMALDPAALRGDLSLDQLQLRASLRWSHYGARFGWDLTYVDLDGDGNDELAVSAPLFDELLGLGTRHAGAVTIVPGGGQFPSAITAIGDTSLSGGTRGGRFGSRVAALRQGDGTPALVVGEPFKDGSVQRSGAVHVFGQSGFWSAKVLVV